MSSPTRIFAFEDIDDAERSARELLADGFQVAIIGPTQSVYLCDEDGDRSYWSREEPAKVILVIGTVDGLDTAHSSGG